MPSDYGANLRASPKDLGMSRADLWTFAGLVALNDYLQFTKGYCFHYNYNITCGDESTPCYSPMPDYARQFRTGRRDCLPKAHASEKNQYRASKVEVHPHEGGNGEMTVKYFADHFGMNGRQALALMGGHTVGQFNAITAHRELLKCQFDPLDPKGAPRGLKKTLKDPQDPKVFSRTLKNLKVSRRTPKDHKGP